MTSSLPEAPTGGSCCSTAPAEGGRENLLAPAAPAASAQSPAPAGDPAHVAEDWAVCPVMTGSPVHKPTAEAAGLFRDFEGQRYYLCCRGCGPKFDENPAHYAALLA